MLQVKRAGHSTITTPDIERAVDYFTGLLGLSLVAREKNRVVLATKSGVESVVLERGETAEVPRLSFQIAPGSDLDEVASRVKKAGLKSERRSDITPGIGHALTFQDPKGTTLEIFSDFEFSGPDNTFTGIMPLKFGHIAYQCPDVQGVVKFYCDMLGFKVSDWRGDFFAFLRCSRDHHTVNFLRDPKTAIHHIAFEVRDWSGNQTRKRHCHWARNPASKRLAWGLRCATSSEKAQHRDISQEHRWRDHRAVLVVRTDARRRSRLLRRPPAVASGCPRHGPEASGATARCRTGGDRCRITRAASRKSPRPPPTPRPPAGPQGRNHRQRPSPLRPWPADRRRRPVRVPHRNSGLR